MSQVLGKVGSHFPLCTVNGLGVVPVGGVHALYFAAVLFFLR
jgi:hypothetical protein